jgi:hypothetical protein
VEDQIVALDAVDIGDRARASERSMHLIRMQIRRLDAGRRTLQLRVHVLGVDRVRVAAPGMVPQVVIEVACLGSAGPAVHVTFSFSAA